MREVVCVSCVSCVSAPGPRAAAAQGRGRVSRHLGPGPRPHAGRDLNQVMKNRSSPAIIQSSSLIRFLGPVICERGLKPCPCVLVWMWDQGSLSHTAHSATVLHARYTQMWDCSKAQKEHPDLWSSLPVVLSRSGIKAINNLKFYPFFITVGYF